MSQSGSNPDFVTIAEYNGPKNLDRETGYLKMDRTAAQELQLVLQNSGRHPDAVGPEEPGPDVIDSTRRPWL